MDVGVDFGVDYPEGFDRFSSGGVAVKAAAGRTDGRAEGQTEGQANGPEGRAAGSSNALGSASVDFRAREPLLAGDMSGDVSGDMSGDASFRDDALSELSRDSEV